MGAQHRSRERTCSEPSTRLVGRHEQSKLRVMCNFNSSEHIESSSQKLSPSSTPAPVWAGVAAQQSAVSLTVISHAAGPGLKPRHPSHNCLVLNMLAREPNSKRPHQKIWFKKINGPEDLNRHLSKEDMEMADEHMKRCSTSPVVRETQIQAAVRHHDTRLARSKPRARQHQKQARVRSNRNPH